MICFYCSAHNLDLWIMGYPKIVEDAKGDMYLNFYAYGVRSLSCHVHHL